MKRKLRRDGCEIHTRQILLVLFREYAAKIQVFKYLNCFSPLNLTTSSSPRRFFTRDVKSYLYASERGIRRSEVRFLMGTQNFLSLFHSRDKTQNIFLYLKFMSVTRHYCFQYCKKELVNPRFKKVNFLQN